MQPTGINLIDDHTALVMTWPGGETCRLGAEQLRRASRVASEIRLQIDDTERFQRSERGGAHENRPAQARVTRPAHASRGQAQRPPVEDNPDGGCLEVI
jgi:hypothetical protein